MTAMTAMTALIAGLAVMTATLAEASLGQCRKVSQ